MPLQYIIIESALAHASFVMIRVSSESTLRWSWLERHDDAIAFANGEYLVCFDLRESFDLLCSWPFDLDEIHGFNLPKTEVETQVALRHDAGAAVDFIHLSMLARDHPHTRSNGGAIALRSHQLDLDPVLFVASVIAKE